MRSVLVTGASSGIGRATAHAFAEHGDTVAVHYSANRQGAEQTRTQLAGDGHMIVCGDVGDPTQARRIVDETVDTLGCLDVLVNNAAVAPTTELYHLVTDVTYDAWCAAWERIIKVNLLGAANVAWASVRHMISGGGGRIINVGSRGAFRGEPEYPAYGASKAGLHALGQSLALALAPHHIAVSSVAPGFVANDRQQTRLASEEGIALRQQSRVGTPSEVAAAIIYLASADAEWASGAILDLNGASHLRT